MVKKKVTDQLVSQIKQLYIDEEQSVPYIAKGLGLGKTTVYRYLKRAGIVPSTSGRACHGHKTYKFAPEIEQQVVRDYLGGTTMTSLRSQYGCGAHAIREAVRRSGGKVRDRGGRKRILSEEQRQEIKRLYAEVGLSQEVVARRMSISVKRVQRCLETHGIAHHRGRRERHGSWKGGRIVNTQGYIMIRPPIDHPFFSMVDSGGYVMEHRLVMAQALGRPLEGWETVHHIDKDAANNRLSNLQLRVGNHGHHIAYRCSNCGSTSIEPYELA